MKKLATTIGLLTLMLIVTSFTTPNEPGNGARKPVVEINKEIIVQEFETGGVKKPNLEYEVGGAKKPKLEYEVGGAKKPKLE